MVKKELIAYLEKVPDDEPLFLIRAQDALGAEITEKWALRARAMGVNHDKVKSAFDTSEEMLQWHTKKIPD